MSWYRWDGDDLVLQVRVQPKASQDAVVGPYNDSLKLRLTAAPVDGKANAHLQKFLAKQFKVSRAQVTIEAGATARCKRVRIEKPQSLIAGIMR